MNTTRTLAIVVLGLVLSTRALQGQDRWRYRDGQLGGDLPSVSALAKVAASDVKTIHQRPAVTQGLAWFPPYFVTGSPAPQNGPDEHYDRYRTAGITHADVDQVLGERRGLALGQQPARYVTAVDVDDHVEVEVRPFLRSP